VIEKLVLHELYDVTSIPVFRETDPVLFGLIDIPSFAWTVLICFSFF